MTILLLVLFLLLQIFDWTLTRRLLLAGVGHEANRIVAFFIQHAGIDLGILTPKAVAVILAYLFLQAHLQLLFLVCVVYIGIVMWNYTLVRSKLD